MRTKKLDTRPSQQECPEPAPTDDAALLTVNDFFAYPAMGLYIYTPTGEFWPASSVDARIAPILDTFDGITTTIRPSTFITQYQTVGQITWAPGAPMLIEDRRIVDGCWVDHPGASVFNLYRPPSIQRGDAAQASLWLDLVAKLFPDPDVVERVILWLAHRVQRPGEKINHTLVIGGQQGIGKDSLLKPVKRSVGPWNFAEIGPTHLLGRSNGFVKSVILCVSGARDLGKIKRFGYKSMKRFGFYERMKLYTGAPPDLIRVDEKQGREYLAPNVAGVIITTDSKTEGIYLPPSDRRHYVAWSTLTRKDFTDNYWADLWRWYEEGGSEHVAAYLAEYDLSAFDPKAPPPKTTAFWDIVEAGRAQEDAKLADALDALGNPSAVTIEMIASEMAPDDRWGLYDERNARLRLEAVGYVSARNPAAPSDGKWTVRDRGRQVVYARHELTPQEQLAEARQLFEKGRRRLCSGY